MANVVAIVGDTGTGKSRSIKDLNPDETFVINVLNKPLPFEGSKDMYSVDKKNSYATDSYSDVINIISTLPEKRPDIKNIIVDDVGFCMTTEFFKRSKESGYSKFSDMGLHMQQILEAAKNIKNDNLNVAFMFHEEDEYSGEVRTNKKVKLIGKMLDDKYNPLNIVSVCLFTHVIFDGNGKPSYHFITNRAMIDGVVIPAKSPEGMLDLVIPNDLNFVFEKIKKYFSK